MHPYGEDQQPETAPGTAEEQSSISRSVTDTEIDETTVNERPVHEDADSRDSDEPLPVSRPECQVVDRPNRKLLRHRQVRARQDALRRIHANPINGDPITSAVRY